MDSFKKDPLKCYLLICVAYNQDAVNTFVNGIFYSRKYS